MPNETRSDLTETQVAALTKVRKRGRFTVADLRDRLNRSHAQAAAYVRVLVARGYVEVVEESLGGRPAIYRRVA